MKKILILLIVNFSFLFCVQNYGYGKIELKNGQFIEGKKLFIYDSTVRLTIGQWKVVEHDISDIRTIWQGIPSVWEIRKGLLIGSSAGLLLAISSSNGLNIESLQAVPILGAVGYSLDYIKSLDKYSGITSNWQAVYNYRMIKNNNIDNSSASKYGELEKLFELKEKGIITNEEYEIEKTKILNTK